ncbi:hypothetical protein [Ectobacillus panaciterrae]|uniref:hypothetical protein n=1 Tax=Ectobacillus panaciterrae TaxID=363872 RepID=UPI00041F9E98|nr:hypothetical protein [Ectobacillus panaciterrae]
MKYKKLIIAAAIVVVAAVLYFVQLNKAIAKEQQKNKHFQEEIASLKNTEVNKAQKTTEQFIQAFFNYDNTLDRYKNIKTYTTEQGYRSTFPSGMEPPTKGADIRSRINELEIFEKKYSKNEITTISTFKVMTTFNDVPSTSKMVIKTNVVKVGSEWKIDDVTILSSQGTSN